MKLSLNWIKDYVQIPGDFEISRIAYDMTMSVVEVENTIELARSFDKMVVGVVNKVMPHPDADKLVVCKTDIGGGDEREIVCGGTNLKDGMKVAVALPGTGQSGGAMVHWHGEGDLVEIKKSKVRGVESYGMICSSNEIGLFDLFPAENDGLIIDLSEFSAPAGTHLAEALGLDDVILEIDNRSLTNRPDLWGHYGMARELSAIYDLPLKELSLYSPSGDEFDLGITLEEPRCPRYIGIQLEGLSPKAAPFDLQSRIWRVGMRPINAIVDITNYIMLATGQPTHAFDADHIKGHINVRRANDGEKLLLLDGKELTLTTEDLVIADDAGSVGLAGVMGGGRDSVLPETNKVILEIANFDALSIRRTAARYDARTESAARFEKGIDPERADMTLSLVIEMFKSIFPKLAVTGFCDNYPKHLNRSKIDVSLNWLEKGLGKRIPSDDIARKLGYLGFDTSFEGDIMHVVAPTWRSTGDISIPNDIMEEVARIHGYENFGSTPIVTSFDSAVKQPGTDRKIREYLAFRCGMNEIYTHPWVNDNLISAILQNSEGMLSLIAPPSPEEKTLRSSLLPNLCKAAADNLRFYNEFSIFESAQVFFDRDYSAVYDKRESLPLQRKHIAGALVGGIGDVHALFVKAKGILSAMPRYIHIEPLTFERSQKPIWADDTVWLNIAANGEVIGSLALLSRKAALKCGIKNNSVILFEIDIECLKPYLSRTNKYTRLPEYPMVEYDLSLLVDLSVKWEDILQIIKSKKDELLRDVSFVDEYRGKQIPDGKKSVTLRLLVGSLSRTLKSEEIENYANVVIKRLKKGIGAEMRG